MADHATPLPLQRRGQPHQLLLVWRHRSVASSTPLRTHRNAKQNTQFRREIWCSRMGQTKSADLSLPCTSIEACWNLPIALLSHVSSSSNSAWSNRWMNANVEAMKTLNLPNSLWDPLWYFQGDPPQWKFAALVAILIAFVAVAYLWTRPDRSATTKQRRPK